MSATVQNKMIWIYKEDRLCEMPSLPDALVPSALAYSVEVGQYLLSLGQGDGQEKKPQ